MSVITERALAKVNLSLSILGRRLDGYHALKSLVVFADIGDELTLEPAPQFELHVSGKFGSAIEGGNLIETVSRKVMDAHPKLRGGIFRLNKNLPVAAGIGGGSADAAAALRLLRRANEEFAAEIDWMEIAGTTGADVPVCYVQRPAIMEGIGERISPIDGLPAFSLLLVNSGFMISTAEIFKRLGAEPYNSDGMQEDAFFDTGCAVDFDEVVRHMTQVGNDLEAPALEICPGIMEIKNLISAEHGCAHAALSGSGGTCFGVFKSHEAAKTAAENLRARRPDWWIAAARVL